MQGHLEEMVRDREPWHAAVYGVTKSWTRLSGGTTGAVERMLNTKANFVFNSLLPA